MFVRVCACFCSTHPGENKCDLCIQPWKAKMASVVSKWTWGCWFVDWGLKKRKWSQHLILLCHLSSVTRLLKFVVRRCAPQSQTWGPTISASWDPSRGTLSCRTSTATGSPSTPVPANPSPRTTRNLRPQNQWSPLLQKELTCTPGLSFLSPSSFSMWFTGPYTCDYLEII